MNEAERKYLESRLDKLIEEGRLIIEDGKVKSSQEPKKCCTWQKPYLMPVGWKKVRDMSGNGVMLVKVLSKKPSDFTTLVLDSRIHSDGKEWLHLSIAHTDKLPTYEELCEAKELFIGKDKKAIQVFAADSEHFNLHPFCLHLWHCLDGDDLPDFRVFGGV